MVNSRLDVKLGIDGMEVLGASAQEWVVRRRAHYSPAAAGNRAAIPAVRQQRESRGRHRRQRPATHPDLSATSLPDVQAGSVVLYRKFQVGEIVNVRPKANEFEVDVYINRNTASC